MNSRSARLGTRVIATFATLALATGLAACGGSEADDTAKGKGKDCDGGGASTSSGDFPRTVKHDQGKTEIPEQPKKVVALDPSLVEAGLALDANVVGGIGTYGENREFPKYLGDATDCTKEVGPLDSPNLEEIIALEPDLIVSASIRHEDLYDELSDIAPTVFVETTGPTWKDNITQLGEALGAEDTAKEELAAYEKRAEQVGKAIKEKANDPEISVVRFMDGPTRLMANESFTGILLSDMGLKRPKAQDVDDFAVEVGEEQIRKADGDRIFVSSYTGGEKSKNEFERNPLWAKLDAVKNDKVHEVDDATWMMSVSLQGAEHVFDDLAEIFDVDPAKG